jgi:hypothetical protein
MISDTGLEKAVKELYIRSGYGRVLKSEIDALVFHHFLLEILGGKDFFKIDKRDIFELSTKLKVSESRIKRLLEDDYLLDPDKKYETHKNETDKNEAFAANLLRDIIPLLDITGESAADGKIRIPVANPVVKKHLELAAYSAGVISDTSFNREIFVIGLADFFKLLNVELEAGKAVKEELKRKLNEKNINQKEAEDLLKKPLPELFKAFVSEQVSGLLGEAAGTLLKSAYDKGVELFRNNHSRTARKN